MRRAVSGLLLACGVTLAPFGTVEETPYGLIRKGILQCAVHLLEGSLGLLEESVNDTPAEVSLFLVVIHLEDLFECDLVYAVAEVQDAGGPCLALHIPLVSSVIRVPMPGK